MLALLVPNLLRARELKGLIYHSGCDGGKAAFRGNIRNTPLAIVDVITWRNPIETMSVEGVRATGSAFAPAPLNIRLAASCFACFSKI